MEEQSSSFRLDVRQGEFESLRNLLEAYVPVFNARSKEPIPSPAFGFAEHRARELWNDCEACTVFMVRSLTGDDIVGGTVVLELSRNRPPRFIPEEIWLRVTEVAGCERKIFYHTALFKFAGFNDVAWLQRQTALVGCHFHAALARINKQTVPSDELDIKWIGTEIWLGESREYYCANIDKGSSCALQ